jgi:hypothetical protein
MDQLHPLVILAVMAVVTLGLPLGLYFLLTRKRRAAMHEIRDGALQRGWKFRLRHWTGNPTAFRIDGRSRNALRMVVRSSSARGYDSRWNATLTVRFPELAGEPDVAVLPRRMSYDSGVKLRGISTEIQAKVAKFSGLAASAIHLLQEGKEAPSGVSSFDSAYQVLCLGVSWQPLVDAKLAERMLAGPGNGDAIHALLMWRDPFGFCVEARLPAPPNWATICHVVGLAEDLSVRLPAGKIPGPPKGIVDELLMRIMGLR